MATIRLQISLKTTMPTISRFELEFTLANDVSTRSSQAARVDETARRNDETARIYEAARVDETARTFTSTRDSEATGASATRSSSTADTKSIS